MKGGREKACEARVLTRHDSPASCFPEAATQDQRRMQLGGRMNVERCNSPASGSLAIAAYPTDASRRVEGTAGGWVASDPRAASPRNVGGARRQSRPLPGMRAACLPRRACDPLDREGLCSSGSVFARQLRCRRLRPQLAKLCVWAASKQVPELSIGVDASCKRCFTRIGRSKRPLNGTKELVENMDTALCAW
eukprot:365702-Chlamydomonas_euryale.AAC.29